MRREPSLSSGPIELRGRRWAAALSFVALAVLQACGGDDGNGVGTGPTPTVTVSVAPTSLAMVVGETADLTATVSGGSGTVTWSSSDASIVTVDATGSLTALSVGSATVTARVSGATSSASVTVGPNIGSIVLNPASFDLEFGDTLRLEATVQDLAGTVVDAPELAWSSSDAAVATVTDEGLVTATGGGSVTISATMQGLSGSASGQLTPFRLEENLRILEASDWVLESSRQEQEGGTYRFTYVGSGEPLIFEAGDVIVGTQGLGFLRKVTSVSGGGASVALQTEPALLDDAVADGSLGFQIPLFHTGIVTPLGVPSPLDGIGRPAAPVRVLADTVYVIGELPEGIELASASADGFGLDINGFDVCKFAKKADASQACPSFINEFKVAKGSFRFDPSFDFDSTWDGDELTAAHGIIEAGITTELVLSVGAKVSTSLTREVTLVEIGRIIYLQVGALPVIVHAEMEVKGKFEAGIGIEGKIQGGVASDHTIAIGGRWQEEGGWEEVFGASGEFTPRQASVDDSTIVLSASLNAKASLTPSLNLKFYALAGPELGLGPWAKAEMITSTDKCEFKSSAGLDGTIGIVLADFLKKSLPAGTSLNKTTTLATLDGASWNCPVGNLRVAAQMSGSNPDPDGFEAQIDGVGIGSVAPGSNLFVGNVKTGARQVTLTGLAENCAVTGSNPVGISLDPTRTVDVAFAVECRGGDPTTTGEVGVSVSTSGRALDTDGYEIRVDSDSRTVDSNGSTTFTALPPGAVTVTLGALEPNCSVTSGNPVNVNVTAGASVGVAFSVECEGGELDVLATASGPFPASASLGYRIDDQDRGSLEIGISRSHDVMIGPHTVELVSIPNACELQGDNPRPAEITDGASEVVTFQLTCSGGDLVVTVATEGENDDLPTTYELLLDDADARGIAIDEGTVTFASLDQGEHTIELLGVPESCTVLGQNPRAFEAPAQVHFDVNCERGGGTIIGGGLPTLFRPDGTGFRSLEGGGTHPSFSADGAFVVVERLHGLYRLDTENSNPLRLTQELRDAYPSVGSDGNVVFTRGTFNGEDEHELWSVPLAGGSPVRLTSVEDSVDAYESDVAGESGRIVFSGFSQSLAEQDYFRLYEAPAEGGDAQLLIEMPGWDLRLPRWSPDESMLAYVRQPRDCGGCTYELVISELTGGGMRTLAAWTLCIPPSGVGSVCFLLRGRPAWSPDGAFLAFAATTPDGSGTWVVDLASGDLTLISETAFIGLDWR